MAHPKFFGDKEPVTKWIEVVEWLRNEYDQLVEAQKTRLTPVERHEVVHRIVLYREWIDEIEELRIGRNVL